MKGVMSLDRTQPLWDAAPILNFQMKYPLSRKRKVSQMRRTSLKAPSRELPASGLTQPTAACGGKLAQACSKRRGESANINGLLE